MNLKPWSYLTMSHTGTVCFGPFGGKSSVQQQRRHGCQVESSGRGNAPHDEPARGFQGRSDHAQDRVSEEEQSRHPFQHGQGEQKNIQDPPFVPIALENDQRPA